MKTSRSAVQRFLLQTAFLVACCAGVRASDDWIGERPADVAIRAPRLDDELFDLWMFEGSRSRFRERLAEQLRVAVRKLDSQYGLSEAERQKLGLAGQADAWRFFERAENLRQKYRETRGDHRKLLVVHREAVALRVDAASRLFDDRSLFAKVVRTLLAGDASRRLATGRTQSLRTDNAALAVVSPLPAHREKDRR